MRKHAAARRTRTVKESDATKVVDLNAKRIANADARGARYRWNWMRNLPVVGTTFDLGGKKIKFTLADRAVACHIAAWINTQPDRGPLHKMWQSQDEIGRAIGIKPRTVRSAEAKIEAIGLLTIVHRGGGISRTTGKGITNLRAIRWEPGTRKPEPGTPSPTNTETQTGEGLSARRDSDSTDSLASQRHGAEAAILGALLSGDPDSGSIIETLAPGNFDGDFHRRAFEAIRACFRKGKRLSLQTIAGELPGGVHDHDRAGLAVLAVNAAGERARDHIDVLKRKGD